MYKYGIIDGNFFLRRNFSAAKFANTLLQYGHKGLVKSFLSTIFNYQQQFELENVIVAWDKLPYKKLADITEYKADRHYATQEDIDKLNELIKEASGKTLEELIAERDKIKFDLDCEGVFHHAKNSILSNLSESRIMNIRMTGYEADDIAYLSSQYLSSLGHSCLLISVDSDWTTFVSPNVSFFKETMFRKKYAGKLITEADAPANDDAKAIGCSLYEVGNLKEVYTGGHNNVSGYSHSSQVNFVDFSKAMLANDTTLPDFEYFHKRVRALNINNYDNQDLIEAVKSITTSPKSDDKVRGYLKSISDSLVPKYDKLCGPQIVGGFLL